MSQIHELLNFIVMRSRGCPSAVVISDCTIDAILKEESNLLERIHTLEQSLSNAQKENSKMCEELEGFKRMDLDAFALCLHNKKYKDES